MDDLTFLDEADAGKISVTGANGLVSIGDLHEGYFEESAPFLLSSVALKDDDAAVIRFKNGESRIAIISLLRYIYLKDYRLSASLIDQPCSILLHLQMYKMSQLYGMPDLEDQAKRYLFCELEYACSVKMMAIDCCNAIRFLYLELDHEQDLKALIGHYCVQNFAYHNLGESEAFRQTVYEAPTFHQLLLRLSMEQGFEADGADKIMRLPICAFEAHQSWDSEIRQAANFMCRLHTDDLQASTVVERDPEPWMEPSRSNSFVLVERPRLGTPNGDNAIQPRSLHPTTQALRSPKPFGDEDFNAFEATTRPGACDMSRATRSVSTGSSNNDEQIHRVLEDSPISVPAHDYDVRDQSDSEWSIIEPISKEYDSNPLIPAAARPSRTGPLDVRSSHSTEDEFDREWEDFKWVNGLQ